MTNAIQNHLRRIVTCSAAALGASLLTSQPLYAQATHASQDWAQSPGAPDDGDSLRLFQTRLRSAIFLLKGRPDQDLPLKLSGSVTAESRTGVRRLRIRNFYTVRIGSPESRETIEELQRSVEAVCPIYNMLKNPQPIAGRIARGPYSEEKEREQMK
jgi:hypothetical protein